MNELERALPFMLIPATMLALIVAIVWLSAFLALDYRRDRRRRQDCSD